AREGDDRGAPECASGAGLGWSVHGLWPQFEEGYPSDCPTSERNPSRRETAEQADIFGSSGLAWYQWQKHGRCSGLSAANYYRLTRLAFEKVTRPSVFRQLDQPVRLPAEVVEEAWLDDNPTLKDEMLRVTCAGDYVQEVRICFTRDLEPRACAPDARRDCTAERVLLPPIR
ncbi:MAG: ribonuclease T, partial [Pseudomonadota bacterium]